MLADISGTVIESTAPFFEGAPGFFLRPKGGGGGLLGLSGLTWGNFLTCTGLGIGIGADCWGAAQPAVRYDSPTWGGFRFETSYGKNQFSGPGIAGILLDIPASLAANDARLAQVNTSDTDFWDIALFYAGDWNSIKLSVAASYTWIETGVTTLGPFIGEEVTVNGTGDNVDLFQIGASIMHKPSGLGIFGLYQLEETDTRFVNFFSLLPANPFGPDFFSIPDTDVWYVKPFWRKAWSPIGATVLYGEYGQYNDQFASLAGFPINFSGGIPACPLPADLVCFVTGSEVERWGLGLVQEIDSAAMHLWLRWQHQELDVDITGFGVPGLGCEPRCRVNQSFDDWDLIQAGGVIFF